MGKEEKVVKIKIGKNWRKVLRWEKTNTIGKKFGNNTEKNIKQRNQNYKILQRIVRRGKRKTERVGKNIYIRVLEDEVRMCWKQLEDTMWF